MKTKSKHFAFLLILFLLVSLLLLSAGKEEKPAALNPGKTFPVKQLQEDFAVFRLSLEEGHGGLYRYTPKEKMDQLFDSDFAKLTRPQTELEFYKLLLPLITAINDGHTRMMLPTAYDNYLGKKPLLFPFNLSFINEPAPSAAAGQEALPQCKVYLFRNYSENTGIPRGAELVSINGLPIADILKKMLPLIPSDAHIETSKFRKLESTTFFGGFYTLLFGETTDFSIQYRPPGQVSLKSATVKGIKGSDIIPIFQKRYPEAAKEEPPISLKYKAGIPVLKIRSFGGYAFTKAKISYPEFLEKTFKELAEKKAQNLIIDLRHNGGGSDAYGKMLFAYLADKPFLYYQALEVKNNTFSFFKYTKIPPEQRKFPEGAFKKNRRGWYDALRHPNLGEQQPLQPTFKGKVYVLIDGASFSASGESTSLMHFHKKALFVGEECGAGYYGNTSGYMPLVTLPHTGLRFNVPLVRYTMAVSGYAADRGIIPDYPLSPKIEDLLQEKDTVLEYTLNLIKKSR